MGPLSQLVDLSISMPCVDVEDRPACRPIPAPDDPSRVEVVLVLPATLSSVRATRTALRWALRNWGWPERAVFHVVVAVSEAIVNAVEHGSIAEGRVTLRATVGEFASVVTVSDEGGGPPVRPHARHRPSDSAHLSDRGRGRALMEALADAVRVRRAGSGTEVTLRFSP